MGVRGQFQSISAALGSAQSMAQLACHGPLHHKIELVLQEFHRASKNNDRLLRVQPYLQRMAEVSASARSMGEIMSPLLQRAKAQFLLTAGHTGFATSRVSTESNVKKLVTDLSDSEALLTVLDANYEKIMSTNRLFEDFSHSDARLFTQTLIRFLLFQSKKFLVMGMAMVSADPTLGPMVAHRVELMRKDRKTVVERMKYVEDSVCQMYASRVSDLPQKQQQRLLQYLRDAYRELVTGADAQSGSTPVTILRKLETDYRAWTQRGIDHRTVVMATAANLALNILKCGSKRARGRIVQAFGPVLRPLMMYCRPHQTRQRVASLSDDVDPLARVNGVAEYCDMVRRYSTAFWHYLSMRMKKNPDLHLANVLGATKVVDEMDIVGGAAEDEPKNFLLKLERNLRKDRRGGVPGEAEQMQLVDMVCHLARENAVVVNLSTAHFAQYPAAVDGHMQPATRPQIVTTGESESRSTEPSRSKTRDQEDAVERMELYMDPTVLDFNLSWVEASEDHDPATGNLRWSEIRRMGALFEFAVNQLTTAEPHLKVASDGQDEELFSDELWTPSTTGAINLTYGQLRIVDSLDDLKPVSDPKRMRDAGNESEGVRDELLDRVYTWNGETSSATSPADAVAVMREDARPALPDFIIGDKTADEASDETFAPPVSKDEL